MPDNDLSPYDLDTMARTMIGEDASPDGQAGVAHVMLNRLRTGKYGASIPAVAHQPNAFEPWGSRAQELSAIPAASPAYQAAYAIAQRAASGELPDPTGGAEYFVNPTLQAKLGRKMPSFAQGQPAAVIGQQAYYRAPGQAAKPLSDDEIGALWGGPSAASAKPLSEDEIGALWGGPSQEAKTPAGVPPPTAAAPAGPLSNAPGDTALSALGKGAATAAIKGMGDVGGFVGNLSNFTDYMMTRAESAVTGKPIGQVQQEHANALAQVSSSPIGRIGNALDPRNVMPSGTDISNPILARTGQYVPQGEPGRIAQSALETAIGAAGPGVGGPSMLRPVAAGINAAMGGFGTGVSDAAGDPLVGMAATMAVPAGLGIAGRTINGLAGRIEPETAALADAARNKYGIPIAPTQMSETPGVGFAGSAINRLPFSGGAAYRVAQQGQFNRAVSNTLGENATKITPDVMNAAKTRIGAIFDRVAQNTTIQADPQFQNDLQTTLLAAHHELADSELKPLDNIFDNIVGKIDPSGNIDGATYQAITRSNTPLGRALDSNNPNIAHWAGEIKGALDDALERSAPPEMRAALSMAKTQYRNLKTIEPIVAKSATGDISPALLAGGVNVKTGNGLAYGYGGDLGDLARIGQKFLKEPPSSGTAERSHALGGLSALKDFAIGAGGASIGLNALGVPAMTPGELLLSGLSIPAGALVARGAGKALRSDWLARGIINRSLGRSYQPGAGNALLFGAVPPTLLNSTSKNALAP